MRGREANVVKAAYGTRAGQPGYNSRADVNSDGVINIYDVAFVSRLLPPGTTCPSTAGSNGPSQTVTEVATDPQQQ